MHMTNNKTILILGNDKIAKSVLSLPELENPDIVVLIDKTSGFSRVIKLLVRRRLKFSLFIKMFICEFFRQDNYFNIKRYNSLNNNSELISNIEQHNPSRIILFRAGLIINKKVISLGVPLLNIHCAKIPEYGGLGSINRAIKDGAIEQCATLHKVTTTIDRGLILDVESYSLSLCKNYCYNEDLAYSAGISLLRRSLATRIGCIN